MSDAIDISVVVPTYNRAASLKGTLEALARQTLESMHYEVIVVDDGSPDNTAEIVAGFQKGHPDLQLRYERLVKNRWKAAACNAGINLARGRLVAFTDDDIRPVPGWLGAHVQRHELQNQDVCVTGLVLYPEEWERASNWVLYANENYRKSEDLAHRNNGYLPPSRLAGGNSSLGRRTLVRVGGFSEERRRNEDGDLACRLHEAGVRVVYEPKALAFHHAEAIQSIDETLKSFRRAYGMDRVAIVRQFPWALAKYGHWFLEPIDRGHDGLVRKATKVLVRVVAKRAVQRIAIRFLKTTDSSRLLYCRALHHYVLTCEALDAIRAAETA
jgi:glycosyltransferase involved in cell wall biosynthesis